MANTSYPRTRSSYRIYGTFSSVATPQAQLTNGTFICRAMLRNEDDYPNATTYNPSRFLTLDGKLNPEIRDPFTIAIGFGRR